MSSNNLRVAHVVLSLDAGGTESLVIDLARRISRSIGVHVCCLDTEGTRADEIRQAGIRIDVMGRRPGFDFRIPGRLRRIARERHINVFHCHQYSPFVYGRLAALTVPDIAVVFTEHGRLSDDPPSRRRRAANLVLGRLPARMFTVSENLRQYMASAGFPQQRIEVVHSGIDAGPPATLDRRCRARAMLGLTARAFVAGTAARLDPVKDLSTMLRAFALVRAQVPSALLVVAGEGTERGRLEEIAASCDVSNAVSFLGHRADVRDLLPAFDIFVNSSTTEGVSVTILEAMAAGLPVVATDVGGTPEVVVNGQTGLLAPSRNPAALSERVLELARDPGLRKVLGRAGRERVVTIFSAERMADRYLQAYREAARRGA